MLLFLASYQVCASQTAKNWVLFTSHSGSGESATEEVCELRVLEPQ